MSDYPMLISNKLHSFRNFHLQTYELIWIIGEFGKGIFGQTLILSQY